MFIRKSAIHAEVTGRIVVMYILLILQLLLILSGHRRLIQHLNTIGYADARTQERNFEKSGLHFLFDCVNFRHQRRQIHDAA